MSGVFFALQVAVLSPPHDPWRAQVASAVREHTRDLRFADQRVLWGRVANHLLAAVDRVALGFWDFVPDGGSEYADWVRGIEDDTAEAWVPDASDARMDHVLVSALFLLAADGASAQTVGERCDLPEDEWRTRATWRHLFATLPLLDFASVRNAALYLTPGGDRAAFSLRELQGEGYDYLLRVE
ncbi:MAG TPA: hypothetical protein VFD82_07770 [Planctomycetota bacterium]|nr:hypothetical protein [Planctomycetota bacterium]